MNLQEGDHLDITVKDGIILIEPVAIYSKSYIRKLEDMVMRINDDSSKDNGGPFKSVEEAADYLEALDDESNTKQNDKK